MAQIEKIRRWEANYPSMYLRGNDPTFVMTLNLFSDPWQGPYMFQTKLSRYRRCFLPLGQNSELMPLALLALGGVSLLGKNPIISGSGPLLCRWNSLLVKDLFTIPHLEQYQFNHSGEPMKRR